MNLTMYAIAAVFVLVALGLVVVPLLRHRSESRVGLILTIMVLILPLSIAATYVGVTSYPWDEPALAATAKQTPQQTTAPPVAEMITALEQRLEQNPEPEGYVLLGRSYIQLQRYADAVDAWHRAWELTEGGVPEISLGYAEALVLADRRTLKTSAADLLDDVLIVRPNDPRALWYGGLSAVERNQNSVAIERFSLLLQTDIPPEMRGVVQEQLAILGSQPVAAAPAATAGDADAGEMIAVTVRIDPEIAALASPNATLFVFAREADIAGPPAAVKRLRAGQLPMEIKLSDADAMAPGSKLQNVSKLKIVARLSASGNAIAATGDLYGEVLPARTDEGYGSVTVLINSVVE